MQPALSVLAVFVESGMPKAGAVGAFMARCSARAWPVSGRKGRTSSRRCFD